MTSSTVAFRRISACVCFGDASLREFWSLENVRFMRLSRSRRGNGETRRAFLALVALSLSGCGGGGGKEAISLPAPSEKTVIGPGDVFTLEIVGEKDIPREFQVASDGTADLPYVQNVEVAGLEPQEVSRVVRQLLIDKKVLTDPIVVVQVKEYNSRSVIVLGQVMKPGSFPITPGLTLLQVISLAGGLTPIANDDRVSLTRKVDAKATKTIVLSVDRITEGKAQDVPLQAGDRIYVYERLF
jgi:protein involved in polysaccharide export with SLBB domain